MLSKKNRRALFSNLIAGFLITLLLCPPLFAFELTLGWDPNPEPDLEGYAVYLKKGSVPGKRDLYGHVAVEDLRDPGNPAETITGLEDNSKYFIALKAYNTAGSYSEFSSPICVQITNSLIEACAQSDPDGSAGGAPSGGSGGGGGGCFITSASESISSWKLAWSFLSLTLFLCLVLACSPRGRRQSSAS
jgi:hypothetical protein